MDLCMFCNNKEITPGYKSPDKTDYLCSTCVQLFLMAQPIDLICAHKLTTDKGYKSKATALKMFIEKQEEEDGNFTRDFKRARITRSIKHKKSRIR